MSTVEPRTRRVDVGTEASVAEINDSRVRCLDRRWVEVADDTWRDGRCLATLSRPRSGRGERVARLT